MLKAIKIQIYPNETQKSYINNLLGTCRFVYNNCLAYRIDSYNNDKSTIGFTQLGKYLTNLKTKDEFSWIKNSHSKVLQQVLINLDIAYKSFFKNGNGFPNFKSKRDNKQSCRFPIDAIGKIYGNRINIILPLKNIHFKCSTKDEKYLNKNQNLIKSATLTKTKSNKYYFSILIEGTSNKTLLKTENVIGIDLGIKTFIVDSNGIEYENIKIQRNNQKKLLKLNRKLSKKVNGSRNKTKARIKLAKFHEKLNNIKENYLHQISNQLLNENQVIVIEDLNVIGMLKNHRLAKSIQELSLNRFKNMLIYKSKWYDRDLIEIDRFYPSSKLCNCCNYKNNDLTLNDRNWECPNCKTNHNRDLNAAINIRNEGLRILGIKSINVESCNNVNKFNNNSDQINKEIKIGLSSPELTPLEKTSMDGSMKKEKNVFS